MRGSNGWQTVCVGILCIFCYFIGSQCTVIWRPTHELKLLREFLHHEEVFVDVSQGPHSVLSTKTATGHLGTITVAFTAYNLSFIVDLQLNRDLFSTRYIQKHYVDDQPIVDNSTKHLENHCYYHGRLRNDPESLAAFSTCQGVRGTIYGNDGVYHIEPTENSIDGNHFVFSDEHQRPKDLTCGMMKMYRSFTGFHSINKDNRKHHRLKRSTIQYWPYDSDRDQRVVEMYIVNDNQEYVDHGYDKEKVISRTKEIINIVSSLYRPIGVYVALVGIEVWTERDLIEVVENPDSTMNNFLTYRREHITVSHPNDNAQLITGQKLGSGVVGKAPIMTICSWQYSGGVNMDHNMVVGPVATTVAHELGHNFGLSHDTDACDCPDDRCIMAASSGGINNPTKWSACSKRQFSDAFEQGMDYCLRNLPGSLSGSSTCGNGFLEKGEECDCGLYQDCNTACCDAFTCRLTENATCATGECCDLDTCKPKAAAAICRETREHCDLPETCDGRSEFCPLRDTHHVDGTPCTSEHGDSYCFQGRCVTHETQCQLLWGRTGHKSDDKCYTHFNVMGEPSGNCGFSWVSKAFQSCASEDVLCGMLHCTHQNEKLMFWKEALTYTMPEGYVTVAGRRHECKAAIMDVGLDSPDPGMVPNGATCGHEKICVAQKCTAVTLLDVKHCPDCHGHGTCNNFGECHCQDNYAPPTCKNPGNGGSLSSGPMTVSNDSEGSRNVGLIVGLCVFFFIIVPLLVLAGIYGYRHRDNLKKIIFHGPAEGYRSIYRAKPHNDIVSHGDKALPPVTMVTRNTSCASNKSNTSAAAVVHPPHPAPAPPRPRVEVRRAASFRCADISDPQLESSTKSLTGIPTLRHSIGATIASGDGPLAHTPTPYVPTRKAPVPPGAAEGRQNRWSRRLNSADPAPPAREAPARPAQPSDISRHPRYHNNPQGIKPPPPTPPDFGQPLGPRGGGGSEGQRYENLDCRGHPLASPDFPDIYGASEPEPDDIYASSARDDHHGVTYVNDTNRQGLFGSSNGTSQQDNSVKSMDHDGAQSGVKDRLKQFEKSKFSKSNKPDSTVPMPRLGGALRNGSVTSGATPSSGATSNNKPPVSRKPTNKPGVTASKPANGGAMTGRSTTNNNSVC